MTRHEFNIYLELYKRGEFGSIPIGNYPDGSYFYMTPKQVRAMELLADNLTTNLGFGGSARSGKSIIECTAIIFDNHAYPGIAWGLGRKELTVLKKTVLKTLYKQLLFYGINEGEDYKYNDKYGIFTFANDSEIFLIDTKFLPSDPLNTRFGGLELTRCAVDESNETSRSVVIKLFERTGWRKNLEYGIKRKLLETFNPAKNHVYTRFFKPFRDNKEPEHKKFIPSLPGDNPHPSVQEWVDDLLKEGDEVDIQRQIYGNFDYDDDPRSLVDYDALCDIFTNTHVEKGAKKISSDLAMQGRDRFVSGYWEGKVCSIEIDKAKATSREIELDLRDLKNSKGVGNTQIIADADGLGNYLEGYIKNITTFRGGSAPENKKDYVNLKSECGWKLAEAINKRELHVICSAEQEEAIKEEVSICLKKLHMDTDTQKKRLIPKDKMKEMLGRSPDYLDMLIMGMTKPRYQRRGQRVLS